jgi:hypothetical protein
VGGQRAAAVTFLLFPHINTCQCTISRPS